jgi:hypothetical protein
MTNRNARNARMEDAGGIQQSSIYSRRSFVGRVCVGQSEFIFSTGITSIYTVL